MLRQSNIQAEFDFNVHAFEIHESENNQVSEDILIKYKGHFIKSAIEVYKRLMNGERLTVLSAINSGISSLPRRIADLRYGKQKKGNRVELVKISELLVIEENKRPYKLWYMAPEQIKFNREKFK